jgi:DNA-binding MarR family transcriptional regulator
MDADDAVRLRSAVSRLARQFNTPATDEGLTPTQASILGLVAYWGPVGPAELQRLEHINPTMLSRVVGRLEERGLVTRTPDPDDLRSIRLTATDSGREAQSRIKQQRSDVVSRAAERLSAEDHATLVLALTALERLADAAVLGTGSTI